jgi:tubulin--tyrosine ligase-like protein 12
LEKTGQFINQIPSENLLTCKDLLASTCQRATLKHEEFESIENDKLLSRGPYWLPVTFNVNTELPQFVQHFQNREKRYVESG